MTPEQQNLIEAVARAICREKCAFMGEPPCFVVMDGTEFPFPPETCSEPGCMAEAAAAIAAIALIALIAPAAITNAEKL
jgi:hypothetical protein